MWSKQNRKAVNIPGLKGKNASKNTGTRDFMSHLTTGAVVTASVIYRHVAYHQAHDLIVPLRDSIKKQGKSMSVESCSVADI